LCKNLGAFFVNFDEFLTLSPAPAFTIGQEAAAALRIKGALVALTANCPDTRGLPINRDPPTG
jgi:hypothetical protein